MTWIDDGGEDTGSYRQSVNLLSRMPSMEWGEHIIKANEHL